MARRYEALAASSVPGARSFTRWNESAALFLIRCANSTVCPTVATPASVPTHAGVATGSGKVSPAALWKGEIDGLAFTITLYDTPGGLLFSSRCEMGAWGLDLDAEHAAFTAQEGFEDKSQAGWPIKQYAVKKPPLSVVYAAGEPDGGVLHTFTAER